jgi:hypothetical protein
MLDAINSIGTCGLVVGPCVHTLVDKLTVQELGSGIAPLVEQGGCGMTRIWLQALLTART